MDAKLNATAAGGEGVLATFFNSLLNKKPGTPGGGGGGGGSPATSLSPSMRNGPADAAAAAAGSIPDKIAVRNDAAAELERLTRNTSIKKEIDFNESTTTNTIKKEIDFSQTDC